MAKFTVELRTLVGSGFDLEMDEYPIFVESYRATLNQKILDHFWLKEIGQETPSRFRHYLKSTMNEIMPYFNQLYASQALETLSLSDVDFREELNRQQTGASTNISAETSEDTATDDLLAVSSETPQALVTAEDIKGNLYASRAGREDNTRTNTRQGNNQSTGSVNNLDTFVRHIYGNRLKDPAGMLADLRRNFLNIDAQIIKELEPLFMGIYE